MYNLFKKSYKTGMGIITKELYQIKIIFSNIVKLCSERVGLTKERFLKITDFDPNPRMVTDA